ncbi:hypothetical protein SUDANB95_08023 (plasmid) [Actinosynnema sp. ALI-1.44]
MTAHLDNAPPTPPRTLLQRIVYLEQETGFSTDAVHDLTYAVETLARAEGDLRDDLGEAFAQIGGWATWVARRLSGTPAAAVTLATAAVAADEPDGDEPTTGRVRPVPLRALREWVNEQVVPYIREAGVHRGGAMLWCRRWPEHHDAVERFTALYHAHRELAATDDPLWLSVYLRDHLDHHLGVLTGPGGSFAACASEEHADRHVDTDGAGEEA